jgi:hypothetical protein
MIRLLLVAIALPVVVAAGQMPPSAQRASALETDLIVATHEDAALTEWAAGRGSLATVTELTPDTPALALVRVSGCQADAGACRVNVDYALHRPDATVAREVKLQTVEDGVTAPPFRFTLTAADPPGLYRVVATVRDMNARRIQHLERIFSLRVDR